MAVPANASNFKLGTALAADFMRSGLLRHPSLGFQAGYARKVTCNKRISRTRVKCKMRWIVGDLYFAGHGMIWITFPEHRPFWNYSYRIVRFNEYCAVLEGDDCTREFVVR